MLHVSCVFYFTDAIYTHICCLSMNTYLKYQPAALQFLAFLMLASGFFILDYAVTTFFFNDINAVMLNPDIAITPAIIQKSKLAQLTASTILFIIPSLLFGYYSSQQPLNYIGFKKNISPLVLLSVVALLFAVQPFVGWLGQVNESINFGSMQKLLQEKEAIYNRILKSFLQMNTPGDLFINLFIMALLPAIGEELFFRGALQTVLLRISDKPWLAILVSSTVFALLHLTVFKVIPIFTLGLLLGTVYYITRNLWYTIVIHFLNNGFAVLAVYYSNSNSFMKKLADDNLDIPLYSAFLSLAAVVFIIYFIRNKSGTAAEESTIEDQNLVS